MNVWINNRRRETAIPTSCICILLVFSFLFLRFLWFRRLLIFLVSDGSVDVDGNADGHDW